MAGPCEWLSVCFIFFLTDRFRIQSGKTKEITTDAKRYSRRDWGFTIQPPRQDRRVSSLAPPTCGTPLGPHLQPDWVAPRPSPLTPHGHSHVNCLTWFCPFLQRTSELPTAICSVLVLGRGSKPGRLQVSHSCDGIGNA